jgi:hypothetical protein
MLHNVLVHTFEASLGIICISCQAWAQSQLRALPVSVPKP